MTLIVESFADELALSGMSRESVREHVLTALTVSRLPMSLLLRASGYTVEFWVATEGGRPVGCYGLHGASPLNITTVAVLPELQGRGIGRTLMEHAFARARELGRGRVVLDVLAANGPAVHLYRSLGMREYDRRRSYTLNLAEYDPEPDTPRELRLSPIETRHLDAWPRVLASSVPVEALQFEHMYRSEYISARLSRWLENHSPLRRTLRRTLLLHGSPAGYVCARIDERQRVGEVLAPLYMPELGRYLRSVLEAATAFARGGRMPLARLYLSEGRPEGWGAAEELGYELERSWLYLYKEV